MHENGVHAEAEAMGCGVRYQSHIAPHVEHPIVTTLADIDRLRVPDPETTFPLNELLKATVSSSAKRPGVPSSTAVPIRARGAGLALCGPERFLTWVGEPESRPAVHRLLDICSRMNIALGEAQIRAGAHSSTIGLAGHSLISPATFDELELPRAGRSVQPAAAWRIRLGPCVRQRNRDVAQSHGHQGGLHRVGSFDRSRVL